MSEKSKDTMACWLAGTVNFPVSESLVHSVLLERSVADEMDYSDVNEQVRDLCKADLCSRIALTSPYRQGATTDSDNGWEHSDGGYTLTDENVDSLLAQANEIYEKYGLPTKSRKKRVEIRIVHGGIYQRKYPL